jgi:hypothetical protein
MVPEAAPQRLAQLGELGTQPPLGQLGQHLRVAFPAHQGGQHRPAETPSTSAATESSLLPASSRVLLDALALGGVGLEPAACGSGSGPAAPGSGPAARSWLAAAPAPAAPPARPHRPRRSCGRAGSWSWRALTSSSSKPRSSSTCQIGFQLLAGGLQHHLGDSFGQPPSQRLQPRGEGRVAADLLVAATVPVGHAHTGHHLVGGHIQPGTARVNQLHRRHLPRLVGGARRGRPIRRR